MEVILFLLLFAAGIAITIVPLVVWIWMLIDCLKNEPSEGNDKIIWILVIVLVNFPGAVIYYFVRRPERIEKYGQ